MIQDLLPFFFALDHVHYARWISIHLRDMETLESSTFAEFTKGNFTVHKTARPFSLMAIYQAHEQNNAHVKGDGGAIGLLEDVHVHQIAMAMGPKAAALPFFHAFSGCDTVSAFHGKGKKYTWQTWSVFQRATPTFTKLSRTPSAIGDEDLLIIEEFVVLLYDRSSPYKEVNEARLDLFARKQKTYDCIPPTKAALREHCKRAVYNPGHIW